MRAIHLELVEDMTAAQFLACLRRFVARRGKSDKIISDNAPQFKVAKNAIDLAWENAVKDPDVTSYVTELRIKWSFIIELSPWMGGFYKRHISKTKMALKKSIGKLCLTSIQLQTILTEIEAVVNSRPLVCINNEVGPWRRGVVVITTAQLHSTKPKLSSEQVQTLFAACRRFAMVRISDNGPDWK